MKKIKYRIKSIKIKIDIAKRAFLFALQVGIRFYKEPRYRKQVVKNKTSKEKYKSFRGNKKVLLNSIIKRDGSICKWCGNELERDEMTIDHLIPIKNGGGNNVDNLRILCEDCHISKTKAENGELSFMKKENYLLS